MNPSFDPVPVDYIDLVPEAARPSSRFRKVVGFFNLRPASPSQSGFEEKVTDLVNIVGQLWDQLNENVDHFEASDRTDAAELVEIAKRTTADAALIVDRLHLLLGTEAQEGPVAEAEELQRTITKRSKEVQEAIRGSGLGGNAQSGGEEPRRNNPLLLDTPGIIGVFEEAAEEPSEPNDRRLDEQDE